MADDLATALRNRFEADALLGARALPICPPAGTGDARERDADAQRRAGTPAPLKQAGTPAPLRQAGTPAPLNRDQRPAARIAAPVEPPVEVDLPERPAVGAEEVERRTLALRVIDDNEVKGCTHCGLHSTRTKTVFGVGSVTARIMFIGEAPGADEDATGEPFVGRAGQLLTDMIQKGMGLKREEVYICNVLKCRPPNNRTPAIDEIIACKGYLWRQIEIIAPQVIITLGAPAAQTILNTREGIGKLRSRWHNFYVSGSESIGEPIPVMPTFHPAYLLRSPGEKAKAWADLKMVMGRMGIPIPAK